MSPKHLIRKCGDLASDCPPSRYRDTRVAKARLAEVHGIGSDVHSGDYAVTSEGTILFRRIIEVRRLPINVLVLREKSPRAYVMGTHIEMSSTPNVDYPIGTTYQPEEHQLPLGISDITKLAEAAARMETPERTYLGSFIVWPSD